MIQLRHKLLGMTVMTALAVGGTSLPLLAAEGASDIEKGKQIAFDRKTGNCVACHVMAGAESPGNIGVPLLQMKARFPEKEKLRAQIWNAMEKNPETSMPPFGKHGIISEKDIDLVTEFIWSL